MGALFTGFVFGGATMRCPELLYEGQLTCRRGME
jgi:hypothetical protein